MPNIVLTRIDNRLVHGQVATQWCGAIGANLILVANDEVAGNSLRQGLMNMAAPAYAAMRYWTIQKTIDTIHKASAKQLIFIVCENPQDVVKLIYQNEFGCEHLIGDPAGMLESTSATCTWQKASARWQVPSQLTTPMWLRSSGCRSLVWNWRSAAFLPNTLKTSKSCSSKLSGCFRKYLKRSIYYGL